MKLENKHAVVTGAGRGIGKAIASRLASLGAAVAIVDIDAETARSTAEEIAATGATAIAYELDITDSDAVFAAFKKITEDLGGIDILVNNAGMTRDNLLIRMSPDDWDLVMKVNLKGAFNCIRAAVRPMMSQRSGQDHQHRLRRRSGRQRGSGELRGVEGGAHRAHEDGREGVRRTRHHRQRGRARFHRDADDRFDSRTRRRRTSRRRYSSGGSGVPRTWRIWLHSSRPMMQTISLARRSTSTVGWRRERITDQGRTLQGPIHQGVRGSMADIAEKVRQVIAEKLQIDAGQVTMEAAIVEDLGADSLEQADILFSLEDEFGITADDTDEAEGLRTVADIVSYLEKKVAAA